jgi:hypothetical protein
MFYIQNNILLWIYGTLNKYYYILVLLLLLLCVINLNLFESLQILGAKSFVFNIGNENIKLQIYRNIIVNSFVWVTILGSHLVGGT